MKNLIERPQDDSFSEFKRFLNEGIGEENYTILYGERDEIMIKTNIQLDMGGTLSLVDSWVEDDPDYQSDMEDDMDDYTSSMDKPDRKEG